MYIFSTYIQRHCLSWLLANRGDTWNCNNEHLFGSENSEEGKELNLVDGGNMADTGSHIANELGAVAVDHLSVLSRRVAGDVLGKLDIEDVGPLLKSLISASGAHERVGETVGNEHASALASVARVRVLDEVAPLLRSVGETLGTGLVGRHGGRAGGTREAGMGGTGVRSTGLEDIGIRSREHVGHHSAGRATHDIDLGGVAAVLLERVLDHGDNAGGVAGVGAVSQAAYALYVPAVAHVRGSGEDQDEALGVGVLG